MPQNTYDTGDTYDVWQYFINGDAERVRERVNAYEAVKAAKHYTTNVAATRSEAPTLSKTLTEGEPHMDTTVKPPHHRKSAAEVALEQQVTSLQNRIEGLEALRDKTFAQIEVLREAKEVTEGMLYRLSAASRSAKGA